MTFSTDNCCAIQRLGWNILRQTQPDDEISRSLKNRLMAYGEEGFQGIDDEAGWLACVLALNSVTTSNFGVGALIVDSTGRVITHGHNEICAPVFRSEAHAEMLVLSSFEAAFPNRKKSGLCLYSSLEPCPMCYTRILISGIPRILYVADDDAGGMVQRSHYMPEFWRALEPNCTFRRAEVRPELRRISFDILSSNMEELLHSLKLQPL
jgi:tRNA(Arg) A34 adenosine deaminase TadA